MKKFLAIFLVTIVLIFFALFAIGSSEDNSSTPQNEPISESNVNFDNSSSTEAGTLNEKNETEDITEQPTEIPTEKVTEKPTEKVTEQSTEKVTEKPTEKVTEPQTKPKDETPTNSESSRTVYITKTGKKYHYENPCGNGTYYASTLSEAKSRGLGPCEKCVLH